jgi:hypothetical protein
MGIDRSASRRVVSPSGVQSDRYIVGWRVSRTAHASFLLDALEQAIDDLRPIHRGGLIHYGDCGSLRLDQVYQAPCRSRDRAVGRQRRRQRFSRDD